MPPVNRLEIARLRRRQSIEATLEIEQERERLLRDRLEELIGDTDAWKLDSDVLPLLDADEVELLEQMMLVEVEPDEDVKEQFEEDIRELREDIVECERRQRALGAFLRALAD